MPTANDIRWFKQQFGQQVQAAVAGTPFDLDMIVAIACQETGYIWSILRRKNLPVDRICALCVGDTIDYKGPGKGRQAFPHNKAALLGEPRGQAMFGIAREALEDMASHVPGYNKAVSKPSKFCHGFGIFQRDLQFFLDDPDYFLDRKYEKFDNSLVHCLEELNRGFNKLNFESRTSLTDNEFAKVAIAYNTGGYRHSRGLQQGYFDGKKYYGERIYDYVTMSRGASASLPPTAQPTAGRYMVIARGGLKLRGGPGTGFGSERTLPAGTELNVVPSTNGDPAWVRVDIEGDGQLDGYVFASFLAPAGAHDESESNEDAPEP